MTETNAAPEEAAKPTVEVKLFNQHEGLYGRDPNIMYLDRAEREAAEIARARAEGREPDLEHPGSTAGTPLVPANRLADNRSTNSATGLAELEEAVTKAHEESGSPVLTVEMEDASGVVPAEEPAPAPTKTTATKTTTSSTSSSTSS